MRQVSLAHHVKLLSVPRTLKEFGTLTTCWFDWYLDSVELLQFVTNSMLLFIVRLRIFSHLRLSIIRLNHIWGAIVCQMISPAFRCVQLIKAAKNQYFQSGYLREIISISICTSPLFDSQVSRYIYRYGCTISDFRLWVQSGPTREICKMHKCTDTFVCQLKQKYC